MAKRPESGLDSLGKSLLSQQATRRDKEDKKRKRASKKMMVLGALVAGQSLVNSSLKRRVNEIKENNTLNMLNSKLYHKKIQKVAQLYDTFDGYDDIKSKFSNPELFEGTSPIPSADGRGAMSGQAPGDPGVNINNLPGMRNWGSVVSKLK